MPTQALVRRLPPALAEVARRPLPGDPSLRGRARRVLLRVLREGGVPAHVRVFQLVDNPQLRFVAADSLVLSQLYWYGEQGWEPELLPWWRHCCRHAGGVLELGANVGYFTVQGGRAAPSTRYLAVEPHPVSWRACRDNLALNGVTLVQLLGAAAVTDPTISPVSLHVPADQLATPTVAFLTDDGELPPEMARDVRMTLKVPAVDVRELLDGVDLLKLDVEGQEHALLSAARAHLRDQRPTVFVEVLPGTPKLRALLAELCEHDGYRCYIAGQDRLTPIEWARLATIRLKDEFGHQDLILSAADGRWQISMATRSRRHAMTVRGRERSRSRDRVFCRLFPIRRTAGPNSRPCGMSHLRSYMRAARSRMEAAGGTLAGDVIVDHVSGQIPHQDRRVHRSR